MENFLNADHSWEVDLLSLVVDQATSSNQLLLTQTSCLDRISTPKHAKWQKHAHKTERLKNKFLIQSTLIQLNRAYTAIKILKRIYIQFIFNIFNRAYPAVHSQCAISIFSVNHCSKYTHGKVDLSSSLVSPCHDNIGCRYAILPQ